MASPKVGIGFPSDKPGHFEQCLRSGTGQTYANTELLVSDDCSTEEIRDICGRERLYQTDFRRRCVKNLRSLVS